MKDKTYKQVHTTIPENYWDFRNEHKLSWSKLLINAIEKEMEENPEILKARIAKNEEEKKELYLKLETAKKRKQQKMERLQNYTKPTIKTYRKKIKGGDDK